MILSIYMAVFMAGSGGSPGYGVVCNQEFVNEKFSASVTRLLNNESEGSIENVLSQCPRDKVLTRLLFLSYLNDRSCDKAKDMTGRLEGRDVETMRLDLDNVLMCFYDIEKYDYAVSFYSDNKPAFELGTDFSARYVYAESLVGSGRVGDAINVFESIVNHGYDESGSGESKSVYIDSLLSLSRMLYSVGKYSESIKYGKRVVDIYPNDAGALEVLVASAAKSVAVSEQDLSEIYCEASRMKMYRDDGRYPDTKAELEIVYEKIIENGKGVIGCSRPSDF